MVVMVRLMIGWDTLKSSAKTSSVCLCCRCRRGAISPWVRLSLWGLAFSRSQVRVFFMLVRIVVNLWRLLQDYGEKQRFLPGRCDMG